MRPYGDLCESDTNTLLWKGWAVHMYAKISTKEKWKSYKSCSGVRENHNP